MKQILVEGEGESARAVGVRLADGRVFRGKTVVSNATRWDTFERLLADEDMPEAEQLFRWAPCFLLVGILTPARLAAAFSCKLNHAQWHLHSTCCFLYACAHNSHACMLLYSTTCTQICAAELL